MPEPSNLFAGLPDASAAEQLETLLAAGPLRIERIVSLGQASPEGFWYDQETDEWVLVVQGAARLRIEGEAEPRELGPGSFVNLPARRRHRVEWTDPAEPTIWVAVHYRAMPEQD
jgi:cupin 2 domain-containing protein